MKKLILTFATLISTLAVNAQVVGGTVTINGTTYTKAAGGTVASYVDLGIKDVNGNAVLWATHNLGASKPEEYGAYIAWGENCTKEEGYVDGLKMKNDSVYYKFDNLKYCSGTDFEGPYTKYVATSKYGTVDNITTLDSEDDAATVNWGSEWRTPTSAELTALRENCTWTWYASDNTDYNGIAGYKVTGTTGNSIFLPATGICDIDSLYVTDNPGFYRSSSICPSYSHSTDGLYFCSDNVQKESYIRSYGLSLRPVRSEKKLKHCNAVEGTATINGNIYTKATGGTVADYVDLGIVIDGKKVLWATHNLGSSKPEDPGAYIAWGENCTKEEGYVNGVKSIEYTDSTLRYYNQATDSFSKYFLDKDLKVVDKTILDSEDDAATVNWGDGWRTPSKKEWNALEDRKNFTWTWDGIKNGYFVKSRIEGYEGNYIFLPITGCRIRADIKFLEESGYYWLNELYFASSFVAYQATFYKDHHYADGDARKCGCCIRPVRSE